MISATREREAQEEKWAHRQQFVRGNRQLEVHASCLSTLEWIELIKRPHLASLLERERLELTNIAVPTPPSGIHKNWCYSAVERQNKLIFEGMFGNDVGI